MHAHPARGLQATRSAADGREQYGPLRTSFTVPVDHRTARTGITAYEKATTILAIVNPDSKPSDFVRPGHLFPLEARRVLRRAGHTEAAVDLARLAGLKPAGVLCEILNENGDRATRSRLHKIAQQHGLPIITIEELIRYRRRIEARLPAGGSGPSHEVRQGPRHRLRREIRNHGTGRRGHRQSLEAAQPPLVRLHSSCFTGDLLASLRCDCGDQLHLALEMIAREGVGVLVYLPQEGRGIGLVEKIKAYHLQDGGLDTVEANLALGHQVDSRDYGVGIQVLKDLGLSRIRLLTNNPKKTDAFIYGGFDLEVVDQVPILGPINEHNARYLATKRDKMGHQLPEDL